MECLGSLPNFLINHIPKSCKGYNFHGGKQKELLRYLEVNQDKVMGSIFFSGSSEGLFPLIWLSKSKLGIIDDTFDFGFRFTNVRLIFMEKTDKEWLNTTRWKETFPKLRKTVADFMNMLPRSNAKIENWTAYEEENFAIMNKSAVQEHVDAIVLECDLLVYNKNEC